MPTYTPAENTKQESTSWGPAVALTVQTATMAGLQEGLQARTQPGNRIPAGWNGKVQQQPLHENTEDRGNWLLWEKSGHIHESKKVTPCSKVWWPRSPSKSSCMSVLLLNKRIWDFLSKFAARVHVLLTSHLALVFPTHKTLLVIYQITIIFNVTLHNIHILCVY